MTTFPQFPNLPKIELPKIEFPKFELPNLATIDRPSPERVVELVRDAAYAGTGLVVLTAERLSELQTKLVETVTTLVSQGVERIRATV